MRFQRILVALDDSPHSHAALEAAAGLAAMMRAEIAGVYVEDINLLRLATLPGSREIVFPMSISREIDRGFMEHSLKDQAEKARQGLAEVASRAGVGWTFSVRQGKVDMELLGLCERADLLVIGKAGHHRGGGARLGSTALGVLRGGVGNLLFLHHGEHRHGPVLLVVDSSIVSSESLSSAVSLVGVMGSVPVVVSMAKTKPASVRLRKTITALPELKGAKFRHLRDDEKGGLNRVAWEEQAGLAIIPGVGHPADARRLAKLTEQLDLPVFLIRASCVSNTPEDRSGSGPT